jgi:hypothetical protein
MRCNVFNFSMFSVSSVVVKKRAGHAPCSLPIWITVFFALWWLIPLTDVPGRKKTGMTGGGLKVGPWQGAQGRNGRNGRNGRMCEGRGNAVRLIREPRQRIVSGWLCDACQQGRWRSERPEWVGGGALPGSSGTEWTFQDYRFVLCPSCYTYKSLALFRSIE